MLRDPVRQRVIAGVHAPDKYARQSCPAHIVTHKGQRSLFSFLSPIAALADQLVVVLINAAECKLFHASANAGLHTLVATHSGQSMSILCCP